MNDSYHHGDLRRTLIAAAVDAIDQGGPGSLSLRAVAKRAGVSHAAPAHHFGDKAGLLTAVAVQGHERFAATLESVWEATGDFLEVGVAYMRFAIDNRPYFEVMFRPELLHQDDLDLVRAAARSRAVLDRGADENGARGHGPDARPTALAAWSLVHGFAGLLMAGNLGPEVEADPEAALRAIASRIVLLGPVLRA